MRGKMFAGLAVAAALGAAPAAEGQAMPFPFSVEGRVDAAFPVGDFGDVADTGVGVGVGASAGIVPGIGVYGTYSHTRFGAGLTGDSPDATSDGFSAGVTAALPGVGPAASPWVGAGLTFHRLKVDGNRDGDVGFEVGGGVAVAVAPNVRLTPGVGFRQYGARVPAIGGVVERDVTVQYLTLGVGVNVVF